MINQMIPSQASLCILYYDLDLGISFVYKGIIGNNHIHTKQAESSVIIHLLLL